MKSFLSTTKIKTAALSSLPLSSLQKTQYPRPIVPRPINYNLSSLGQTRNYSNSATPLTNSTGINLSFNAKLSPLNKTPILQQKKITFDCPINPVKQAANIKPQLSMAPNFQHNPVLGMNLPSNKLGFLSKQYFLLKGQKMVLEMSIERVIEFTKKVEEYNNSQNKSDDNISKAYDQISELLESLLELLEYSNNASYGELFSYIAEKMEILQSHLATLKQIHKPLVPSKSMYSNLNLNHIQNDTNLNTLINDIQKTISSVLSGLITVSRVRSTICFSSDREKSTGKISEVKSTPIGDFTEIFPGDDSDKTGQGSNANKELISQIQEIDKNEENFICRICEEVVPLDLIEEHSALCIKAHQGQYHFYLCGEKLKKIQSKIADTVLSVKWPADEDLAISVIFPVLLYYSLIGMAIDVQNSDADAGNQLETIIHELSEWEIPDAENKNLKLYLIGRQLVNKKLQFFNEIANTAKKISTTTRRRKASTTGGFLTSLSDFEFIARLSSGAYARVFLSRKSRTGDLFAIKVIKRERMSQKNQIKAVSAERDIMKKLNSPYIVYFCM